MRRGGCSVRIACCALVGGGGLLVSILISKVEEGDG